MTIDKQTRQRKIRGSTAESRCGVHDEVSETQQRSKRDTTTRGKGGRVRLGESRRRKRTLGHGKRRYWQGLCLCVVHANAASGRSPAR